MGRAIARDGLNACSLSHGLLKDEHLMRLTTLLMMCVATVLLQGLAQAETYLGGMLGVAVPLPGPVSVVRSVSEWREWEPVS